VNPHRFDPDPIFYFDVNPGPDQILVLRMLENHNFGLLFFRAFIFLVRITGFIIFNILDSIIKFSGKSIA
jgi:hypothetical protein